MPSKSKKYLSKAKQKQETKKNVFFLNFWIICNIMNLCYYILVPANIFLSSGLYPEINCLPLQWFVWILDEEYLLLI